MLCFRTTKCFSTKLRTCHKFRNDITTRSKIWDFFKRKRSPYLTPDPRLPIQNITHEDGQTSSVVDEYHFVRTVLRDDLTNPQKEIDSYLAHENQYFYNYLHQNRKFFRELKAEIEETRNKYSNNQNRDRINSIEVSNGYLYIEVKLAELLPIYFRIPVDTHNSETVMRVIEELESLGSPSALCRIICELLAQNRSEKQMSLRASVASRGIISNIEIVIDQNVDLPRGTMLTRCKLSPSQQLIAYQFHFDGRVIAHVKDIKTREILAIIDIDHLSVTSIEFADDERDTLFFTLNDDMYRSCKLMTYKISTGAVDEIYYEKDASFFMEISRTKDDKFLLLNIASKSANEVYIVKKDRNGAVSLAPLSLRQYGVQYAVESDGMEFIIVTNRDGCVNHKVMRLPHHMVGKVDDTLWIEYLPYSNDQHIDDIDVFTDRIALYETLPGGFTQIRIAYKNGHIDTVPLPDMIIVEPGVNHTPTGSLLFFSYYSPVTPIRKCVYDMNTKTIRMLDILLDNFIGREEITQSFVMKRLFVPNEDIVVPLTLVHDRNIKLDGRNPVLLTAYGAYGTSLDLSFEPQRIVLLKRGFIIAFAHVRGGSEMGSQWHIQGIGMNKMNSFRDFISCTHYLINQKYTNPEIICAKGVSAGAMIVATAGICMYPELFRSFILKVPFLDVLTIMLDPTLPLTEHERDEWGDPTKSKEVFEYIKNYSPYERLLVSDYFRTRSWNNRTIMVSAAWDDFRAPAWNAIKFVARIRRLCREYGDHPLILMQMHTEGHYDDASGIEALSDDIAIEYGIIIKSITS